MADRNVSIPGSFKGKPHSLDLVDCLVPWLKPFDYTHHQELQHVVLTTDLEVAAKGVWGSYCDEISDH